ncbi:LANO_0H24586g1_1 [Lachancea nothofagi CBS 11611]|uniref:LANO_0H24586g1_1 n=1 Tax=Lachancea nothofagi CBS 11611 TaxID=1266666 RepID=A0A1G4KNU3_9SACH|nr:LANO_0H24586g1_1 [Lachancea nothofagi CBS 11611]
MRAWQVYKTSSRDIRLCWVSAFLRLASYGLTNQILTLFLTEIGISEKETGWFMSLTLVGDVCISYLLTWHADAWGRRRILTYGAVMMVLSGMVFSWTENFYVLLIFAIFGVISPSSDEVGPFKSIEESMMAHLTPHNRRPEIYAIHSFVSISGSALGSIFCGWFVHILKNNTMLDTDLKCYKAVFGLYTILALGKLISILLLSEAAELDAHQHEQLDTQQIMDETVPLVDVGSKSVSKMAPETVTVMLKLLVIFMLDSFGYGFMTSAWTVFYYSVVFGLGPAALGVLFFVAKIMMALSSLPSSTIARSFGPVKATLLVQVPSAIFFILIPFAESHLSLSVLFFNLYNLTTAMDVIPRQILLTNIVKPSDLTRVMGIVNIGKTFARCIGPIFTGLLADRGLLWCCYLISSVFVLLADSVLAFLFLDIDTHVMKTTNL